MVTNKVRKRLALEDPNPSQNKKESKQFKKDKDSKKEMAVAITVNEATQMQNAFKPNYERPVTR